MQLQRDLHYSNDNCEGQKGGSRTDAVFPYSPSVKMAPGASADAPGAEI